jgi:dTDP-4-dehydrorhamnose reductase
MKTIAIIGKSGQLAFELAQLKTNDINIICFGRNDININDTETLIATFKQHQINAVINASAYTAVDLAETETENAYDINAKAVANIATACKQLAIHLVHISTDYVFAGNKGSPYLPTDPINPIGVYGKSKAEGEQAVSHILKEKGCVIRTSWVYSVHGNNFVKTMIKLMANKPELGVICDQIGSPTSAKNLAHVCLMASTQQISGTHHYTDAGVASWYDFAQAIQRLAIEHDLLKKEIPINPINTEDYPTPAKRPSYSVLDKKSLYNALPTLVAIHWQSALVHVIKDLT